ncbi:putative small heat shock protein (HSP20) family protein [Lyophyllum shimeji]|uniref:Small heat shock protein (HSP20) family protein n=1 Tax=Lyophyllum shimeji TaxID=47721 RepID=A0A9P3PVM9_LYOSH|nr:putative small heat shock protein (HSP20) family protein [Lyophyllum shimeji]
MSQSVLVYEPFYDFDRFFEAFSPLVNNNNNNNINNALQARRLSDDNAVRPLRPRMDLFENQERNQVTATFELPGMRKEDVNIDLQNGRLIVSGQARTSEQREENGYAVRERRSGRFSRTLQLPQGVKDRDIKASMENGVLTVTFPRTTPEMASKRISVQ